MWAEDTRNACRADRVFTAAAWSAGLLACAVPLSILGWLAWNGLGIVDAAFLTQGPRGQPIGTAGGIRPAVEGSLALVGIGLALAVPAGLGGAIFIAEYGAGRRWLSAARFAIECLASTPSILYGLVGYALLVVQAGLGISLLAGGITLAATMVPIVLIGSHAALQGVDPAEREAGLALGVTRWFVLRRVLLPRAWPGVTAAVVLAAGHAFGSAAPVLFTASVVYARGGVDLTQPVMTLPTHLYYLVGEATSFTHAYGTALVLAWLLLAGNGLAMALGRRGRPA